MCVAYHFILLIILTLHSVSYRLFLFVWKLFENKGLVVKLQTNDNNNLYKIPESIKQMSEYGLLYDVRKLNLYFINF